MWLTMFLSRGFSLSAQGLAKSLLKFLGFYLYFQESISLLISQRTSRRENFPGYFVVNERSPFSWHATHSENTLYFQRKTYTLQTQWDRYLAQPPFCYLDLQASSNRLNLWLNQNAHLFHNFKSIFFTHRYFLNPNQGGIVWDFLFHL